MKSTCGAAIAAALLVAAASPAVAQDLLQDTIRLTLRAAVARGVDLSEEVRTTRAQRQIAQGQVIEARAGALPQVTANVGYTRTLASIFDDISFDFGDDENGDDESPFGALPFGQPNIWTASLQITQSLYAGGRVGTAMRIARQVRRAADLEIEEAETEIALQVRTAYLRAVLAQAFVAIAREAHELAAAQLAQVELFFQQGTASEFDVLRARVERDNLEPAIIEATNARRLAELDLKRLVNIPPEQPVSLVTQLEPRIADVDRAALYDALERRPALGALDAAVAAREDAVSIARADRLPTLGAVANFGYQAFPEQVTPFDATWRRDWTLGMQFTVPLFDGFRTHGRVRQARGELEQTRMQRAQVREGIELELEAALGEFDAARAQIEARRATVVEARRTLELAELRFRSGLATQLDISSARLLLEQARLNEAQSLFDYVNALARLERVTGGEIPLVEQRLPAGG